MDYQELDNLDDLQDTLLALASYDWYFFNNDRIYGLKKDYHVTAKNADIFTYYHGKHEYMHELNHERYCQQYKKYLSAMIYALQA